MHQSTNSLVLGATGFIGGQIARAAVAHGWQVRALRRQPDAVGAIGDLAVEWVAGDLADPQALAAAMRGCDVVFHCAAAYPHNPRHLAEDVRRATAQMQGVLAAASAAGVRRLVYTSSFTTVGPPGTTEAVTTQGVAGRLADERDPYIPGSSGDPYYEAKWAMEVLALAHRGGPEVVALCPTAVFGPGDVHLSVSEPLLMVARRRLPVTIDAPLGVVDVRDVAAAHIAAAEHGRAGTRTILNGHNLNLADLLRETARIAGVRAPRWRIGPRALSALIAVGGLLPELGGQVSYLRTTRLWQPLSNARAVAELGLAPRPLAETLADALAWFRARGQLPA